MGQDCCLLNSLQKDVYIYCNLSMVYCSKKWIHSRYFSFYLNDSLFLFTAATEL